MPGSRRAAGAARRRARLREDRAAVSDVLGSLMLVGITVMAAVGLGLLLLSFDGPVDQLQADVELRTDPGDDGWGTGDETLQIVHLGGEAIPADGVTIRFTVGSTSYCFGEEAGCQPLTSAFSDGELTIGETWEAVTTPPLELEEDTGVDVSVRVTGEVSQVLAAGIVSGTGAEGISCTVDATAPTGVFSHADLKTSDRTAAFEVKLVPIDACGTVDTAVLPNLHYRITPALSGEPDDFTDSGSDLGNMTWRGTYFNLTIPAPTGALGWASAWGRTVQFFASGLSDTVTPTPNVGNTSVDSEVIQVIGASAAEPENITLTAGAFTAAGPATALEDDDGTTAALQEACMVTTPSLLNVQSLCGTVTGGSGTFSNAANAVFSDNSRSTHSGTGSSVEVSGFDVPAATGDISTFSVVWEGSRGGGSGDNPNLAIEANFGPDYSSTSTGWSLVGSLTPSASEGTSTLPVLLTGPWTADQFSNLHLRARVSNTATKDITTDAFYIIVTYPSSTTARDLDAEFEWDLSSLAAGSAIRQLRMEYSSGETYTVEVLDTGGVWNSSACASLAVTALTAYTCDLTEAQVSQGPTIRIRGAASTDTAAPPSVMFDYVHMLVVQ